MIWDTVPHQRGVLVTDVPGLGRYMIKRPAKFYREHRLFLNGKGTGYFGTPEQLKAAVDRIVASRILGSKP